MRNRQRRRLQRWWLVALSLLVIAIALGSIFWVLAKPTPQAKAPATDSPATVRVAKKSTTTQSASAASQTSAPVQVKPAVQSALANTLSPAGFSGTALIVQNGKVTARYAAGLANAAGKRNNGPDTMYEIDSVQKVMTGTMIMKQIAAGHLTMATTLSRFFPTAPGADQITIRQLLDMCSGLRYKPTFRAVAYQSDLQVVTHLISQIKYLPAENGKWHYDGLNYQLLSGVLVKLTGKTYQQLFDETFVQKLQLKHTRFAYEGPIKAMATGYAWNTKTAKIDHQKTVGASNAAAHAELGTGQVYMSAADLYRVESAIQDGTLLTTAQAKTLFTSGSGSLYAGGLYQGTYRYANGDGYGFECFLRISRGGKNAVVVMTNTGAPTDLIKPLADTLAATYLAK